MNSVLLSIQNLSVRIGKTDLLHNINLEINESEKHILVGPNGSGKSTLSKVIVGHPAYHVYNGSIVLKGRNIIDLSAAERANEGIFLAFQVPLTISSITNFDFLHLIYNNRQKNINKLELSPLAFMTFVTPILKKLNMPLNFLYRGFNTDLSGGEKKKNELLQLILLQPALIVLDEIDAGLDIDSMKTFFSLLGHFLPSTTSFLIITHNPLFLQNFNSTRIHILKKGTIQKSGPISLLEEITLRGYNHI